MLIGGAIKFETVLTCNKSILIITINFVNLVNLEHSQAILPLFTYDVFIDSV